MADATVAVTPGRVASFLNLSAIKITVTYSATAYATATGGLPFDLFSVLATAGAHQINSSDILGLIAGPTTEKFVVAANTFAVGTVTDTTIPCTVRILACGANAQDPLVEISDANLTGSFTGFLLVARGSV